MKIDVADSIREFQKQTLKWHAARVEEKVSLINEVIRVALLELWLLLLVLCK